MNDGAAAPHRNNVSQVTRHTKLGFIVKNKKVMRTLLPSSWPPSLMPPCKSRLAAFSP